AAAPRGTPRAATLDDEAVDAVGSVLRDRVAVADAHDPGVERGHSTHRFAVLLDVEVEGVPAGTELGPGGDGVAGDEEAALRPPEGEMAGRVPGGVQPLKRAERVTLREGLVHRAGNVSRPVEPEPDLERQEPQRLPRQDRDRLGATVPADDVRLPL